MSLSFMKWTELYCLLKYKLVNLRLKLIESWKSTHTVYTQFCFNFMAQVIGEIVKMSSNKNPLEWIIRIIKVG